MLADTRWKSDPEQTGENIKARRKELNMTQVELAEELGGTMTNRSISNYECGKHEMGLQTFFDIAEALHTTPDQLAPFRFREGKGIDAWMHELSEKFLSINENTRHHAFRCVVALLDAYDIE